MNTPPRRQLARQAWGYLKCLLNPAKCREVDRLLYQYVERELDAPTRQRLEKHIADCPSCLEYVESYRQVTLLAGQGGCPCQKMPAELERKLRDFIETNPELRQL